MESLETLLRPIEEKWLDLLYDICRREYAKVHLPSHDHTHHRRVWKFATEILQQLDKAGFEFTSSEIESLIIAVFFHDQGMTVTREKDHGRESRRLCEDFFLIHPELIIHNPDEVFRMIELHDEKDYVLFPQVYRKPGIQSILNIADDLDALGVIGVYRYAEIYFLRGIPIHKLPALILPNLESRFIHFKHLLGYLESLVKNHTMRYQYIQRFYLDLAEAFEKDDSMNKGPIKVIKILTDFSVQKNAPADYLLTQAHKHSSDSYTRNFFKDLSRSLEEK